jgi:hypothetical protein
MARRIILLFAGLIAASLMLALHVPPVAAQAAGGTIEGVVHVTGSAPPNAIIRMGADPRCSKLYAGKRITQETVLVGAGGGLANAFVNLQGSFPRTAPPSEPVMINQQGCIYRPHVLGAQIGQTLEIKNSDPTMHNLHSLSTHGNAFNTSQPSAGMVFKVQLKNEDVMLHLKCDVHSWMTSYIGVVSNPYFAVSGSDGSFKIAGVPAGKQTVQVWHERFGPLMQTVEVKPGATTKVEFSYTGTEKPAPAAGLAIRELTLAMGK